MVPFLLQVYTETGTALGWTRGEVKTAYECSNLWPRLTLGTPQSMQTEAALVDIDTHAELASLWTSVLVPSKTPFPLSRVFLHDALSLSLRFLPMFALPSHSAPHPLILVFGLRGPDISTALTPSFRLQHVPGRRTSAQRL